MSLSMYQASIPVFRHMLGGLSNILTKAACHAEARKIDPAVLLQARLFPDMFPLVRQVQIAADSAKSAAGNLAGVEIPRFEDVESTFPEIQERIERTQNYLATFRPEQIDGTEDKDITLTMRGTSVAFKGQQYLLGFALPNFYFHITTAYGILRQSGVEIGKRDFLGAT